MTKTISKKRPNEKKRARSWLRKRISWCDHGRKYQPLDGKAHPIHSNKQHVILDKFFGRAETFRYLTVRNLNDHEMELTTYYFTGAPKGETLIMLDIDCHHKGSLEGAEECANALRRYFGDDLYIEPSSRGWHGYFVVTYDDLDVPQLNALLSQLEERLNYLTPGFDIEKIEIKGKPTELAGQWCWGIKKWRPTEVTKSGSLAALPRDLVACSKTCTLAPSDLTAMMEQIAADFSAPTVEEKKVIERSGSKCFTFHVDRLPKYQRFARKLVYRMGGMKVLQCSGREQVTLEDVGLFLLLWNYFERHRNPDGGMPWARFQWWWTELRNQEVTDRAFSSKRFKAIRDFLSDCGLIRWLDNSYCRDRAARWEMEPVFKAELEGAISNKVSGESSSTSVREQVPVVFELLSGMRPEFRINGTDWRQFLPELEKILGMKGIE